MSVKSDKDKIEKRMPFYCAFYGYRPAPSQIKRVEKKFGEMVKMFKEDLEYYHPDVKPEKISEGILRGLEVLRRLGGFSPESYLKDAGNIAGRAFKHADRFLCGTPLPLPPISDEEEAVDEAKKKVKRSQETLRQGRDSQREKPAISRSTQSIIEGIKKKFSIEFKEEVN